MSNAHDILGVSISATQNEILAAYRKARVAAHPDKGGSVELFKKVQDAFKQLRHKKCSICAGKGFTTLRFGIFTRKAQCEVCWGLIKKD